MRILIIHVSLLKNIKPINAQTLKHLLLSYANKKPSERLLVILPTTCQPCLLIIRASRARRLEFVVTPLVIFSHRKDGVAIERLSWGHNRLLWLGSRQWRDVTSSIAMPWRRVVCRRVAQRTLLLIERVPHRCNFETFVVLCDLSRCQFVANITFQII
jgi:hypothetical protein